MARQVRSVSKPLTPEERERHRQIRAEVERDKPALMALGRQIRGGHERLRQAIAALKSKREELGLSLMEVGERTGIGKANLSRLENAAHPNPTIGTLMRYADALGTEIRITLAEGAEAEEIKSRQSKDRQPE